MSGSSPLIGSGKNAAHEAIVADYGAFLDSVKSIKIRPCKIYARRFYLRAAP